MQVGVRSAYAYAYAYTYAHAYAYAYAVLCYAAPCRVGCLPVGTGLWLCADYELDLNACGRYKTFRFGQPFVGRYQVILIVDFQGRRGAGGEGGIWERR